MVRIYKAMADELLKTDIIGKRLDDVIHGEHKITDIEWGIIFENINRHRVEIHEGFNTWSHDLTYAYWKEYIKTEKGKSLPVYVDFYYVGFENNYCYLQYEEVYNLYIQKIHELINADPDVANLIIKPLKEIKNQRRYSRFVELVSNFERAYPLIHKACGIQKEDCIYTVFGVYMPAVDSLKKATFGNDHSFIESKARIRYMEAYDRYIDRNAKGKEPTYVPSAYEHGWFNFMIKTDYCIGYDNIVDNYEKIDYVLYTNFYPNAFIDGKPRTK